MGVAEVKTHHGFLTLIQFFRLFSRPKKKINKMLALEKVKD